MIKLLLIILIVFIAFWMGRQSAGNRDKQVREKHIDDKAPVIDIETED